MRESRVRGTLDRRSTKQTLPPGKSRPTEVTVEILASEGFADLHLLFNDLVPYSNTIRSAMGRIKNGNNSEVALRSLNSHINSARRLLQKIERGLQVLQNEKGLWVRRKFPETRTKVEASIKDAEELLEKLASHTQS